MNKLGSSSHLSQLETNLAFQFVIVTIAVMIQDSILNNIYDNHIYLSNHKTINTRMHKV